MGNKRNPSVVVAVSSVLRFLKDLDDRIFPLLGGFSCYPNIDKDVVISLGECGVVDFQEFDREIIWPYSFPIWHHLLKCFRHLVQGRFISEG